MKKLICGGVLSALIGATHAQGIPVIDVAALAQALIQVQAWEQQYGQMYQQLLQQQQMIQSNTGLRNLGQIQNSIQAPILPPDTSEMVVNMKTHVALDSFAAQGFGALRQALQTRSSQIQSLMREINQTQDPKAIAELQARIQSEQVMAANEAKEAELLQKQVDAQRRAIDATNLQENLRRVKP